MATGALVAGAACSPSPTPSASTSTGGSIVGSWSEDIDGQSCCTVTYLADGTASSTHDVANHGTWTQSGNKVTATWAGFYVDSLTLNPDGQTLTGSNNAGHTILETRVSSATDGADGSVGSTSCETYVAASELDDAVPQDCQSVDGDEVCGTETATGESCCCNATDGFVCVQPSGVTSTTGCGFCATSSNSVPGPVTCAVDVDGAPITCPAGTTCMRNSDGSGYKCCM